MANLEPPQLGLFPYHDLLGGKALFRPVKTDALAYLAVRSGSTKAAASKSSAKAQFHANVGIQ
jgi:hypothetical protein